MSTFLISDLDEQSRAVFNPAFLSLIIAIASDGYYEETKEELPILLTYLILPVVLHVRTRERLPSIITTSMGVWLERNPSVLAELSDRVTDSKMIVNSAIIFGCSNRVLELSTSSYRIKSGKYSKTTPKFVSSLSDDCQLALKTARYLGRWFGLSGSPQTILALWGYTV